MELFLLYLFTSILTVTAIPLPYSFDPPVDEAGVNLKAKPDGVVQVDMKLTSEQMSLFEPPNSDPRIANAAIAYKSWLWENGVVPVKIAFGFTNTEITYIRGKMKLLEDASCIKFEILDDVTVNYPDYVEVIKGTGCWSYIGRLGGKQQLSLGSGCLSGRVIPHEFLHALGFFHEQARPDRDSYVKIFTENIQAGKEHNFNKQSSGNVDSKDVPYDLLSIMHYKRWYFSKNGQDTIQPVDPNYTGPLGGDILTASDLKQLNLLYECDITTTSIPTTTTTTTTTTTKPTTTTSTSKPTTTTTTTKPTTTLTTTTRPTTTTTTTKPTTTTTTTKPTTTATTTKPTTTKTTTKPTTTTTTLKPTTTTTTTKPTTTTTTTTKPTTTTTTTKPTTTPTTKEPTTTTTTTKPTTTATTTKATTKTTTTKPTTTTTTTKPTTTTTTTKPTTTKTTTIEPTTTTTTTKPTTTTTTTKPTTTTTTTKPATTSKPTACKDKTYWCNQYPEKCNTIEAFRTIYCPCFCNSIS